jgi:hypothetical protein
MMPVYKRATVHKEACPSCGEFLERVYSCFQTWKCSCGAWVYDWMTREYEIIPIPQHVNGDASA